MVAASMVATIASLSTPLHAADYWTVLALVQDEKAQEMPIRYGDATLGYTKACQLHNFFNGMITAYCLGSPRCPDTVNRSA